jgi:hypothetical protein
MPLNQTLPIASVAINACNDATESGLNNPITGAPYYSGLVQGDYFDLTNAEASQLSYLTNGKLYAGRYRRVQVDSGATASNIKVGTIGLMPAGLQPVANIVTSYDKGIVGAHPVIFLNAVTPGNFCFVQELGFASVLAGATLTKSGPNTGDLLNSTTLGVFDDPTVQELVPASIGIALSPPSPNTLCLVQLNLPVTQG